MESNALHWGFTAYRVITRNGKPTPQEVPITVMRRYVYTNQNGYKKKFDIHTGVLVDESCMTDRYGYIERIFPTKAAALRWIRMREIEKLLKSEQSNENRGSKKEP